MMHFILLKLANNEIVTAHPSWSICIWHLKRTVCLVFVGSSPTQLWNFVCEIFIHESHSCISHLHFVSPYVWLRGHQQHALRNLWANRHPPAPCAQLSIVLLSLISYEWRDSPSCMDLSDGGRDHSHPQALSTLLMSFDGI